MKSGHPIQSANRQSANRFVRGFSLIELMIAVTLGILVSIGLVTLFGATSKANRVQDALARLQENGRFGMHRIAYDIRMGEHQLMNATAFASEPATVNGTVTSVVAPQVYVASLPFPDGDLERPPTWDPNKTWWPLSPRYFLQGYDCSNSCDVPASIAPPIDTLSDGQRVKKSDVLLVRYLNTRGWSSFNGEVATVCAGANLENVVLTPNTSTAVGSPVSNFATDDLAMLSYSNGASYIFRINVSGNVLTPQIANGGTIGGCSDIAGGPEVTLFNFSKDFITVVYWLQLVADPDRGNQLTPTLMRSEANNAGNSATRPLLSDPQAQQLAQGAEQLEFVYGVQAADGSTHYLSAADVQASPATQCAPPPQQYVQFIPGTMEPDGCLWRAVQTIETHVLFDTVQDMYDLTPTEMAYRFNAAFVYRGDVAPPEQQPSGLPFGHLMRREFIALTSIRNFNP